MSEGLRERKKAETRRALSSAALRLADGLGPDRVTVEAIADAAGVSPRTFFNYFSSKEDAIVGLSPAQPSDLLRALEERPADEAPLEALRRALHSSADRLEAAAEDSVIRRRLFQRHPALAARQSSRFAEVERGLVEEIARRTGLDPDRDAYPALVVSAALGAARVTLAVWVEQDRPGPITAVLDRAFDDLARGLEPPQTVLTLGSADLA